MFCKKVFLKISQNSQENTCARVSFLIKWQTPPATLLKRRLWHRCFPVNFAKFSIQEHLFLQRTSGGCFCNYNLQIYNAADPLFISETVVRSCSVKKVKAYNFIKKSIWHRCFPVNFAIFLRTPFFTEHLRWLLLHYVTYDLMIQQKAP